MKQINHLSSPHPPPSPSQRENKQSLTFSSANKVCFALGGSHSHLGSTNGGGEGDEWSPISPCCGKFTLLSAVCQPPPRAHRLPVHIPGITSVSGDLKNRFAGTLSVGWGGLISPEWSMLVEKWLPDQPSEKRLWSVVLKSSRTQRLVPPQTQQDEKQRQLFWLLNTFPLFQAGARTRHTQ